jgi:hypothetical protein
MFRHRHGMMAKKFHQKNGLQTGTVPLWPEMQKALILQGFSDYMRQP